jgi:hypothetical protein
MHCTALHSHFDRQQSWPSSCSSGYNNGKFVLATQKWFHSAKISPRCNFFLLTVSLLDVSEKKIYLKQKKWLKIFDGGLRPLLQPQQMGGKILKNPSLSLARSSDRSHGGGLISYLLKKNIQKF